MAAKFGIALWAVFFLACQKAVDPDRVARVNTTYLSQKEIKKTWEAQQMRSNDSAVLIGNYITRWATKQLFLDRAKENLSDAKLKSLDSLVEDYRNTLYIKSYKDALVTKMLDTVVSAEAIMSYYQQHKKNFNLNKTLVKLRYLHLDHSQARMDATHDFFARYTDEDRRRLLDMKYAYKAFSLKDSVWLPYDQVVLKMPVLATQKREAVLKNKGVLQLKDSLGVYLIKIKKVLEPKEIAPLEYIKPTIKQIIINKRKLALIKKLEKEITKDGIKNEQFEIYN